jgi:hypothetical protein
LCAGGGEEREEREEDKERGFGFGLKPVGENFCGYHFAGPNGGVKVCRLIVHFLLASLRHILLGSNYTTRLKLE